MRSNSTDEAAEETEIDTKNTHKQSADTAGDLWLPEMANQKLSHCHLLILNRSFGAKRMEDWGKKTAKKKS